MARNDDWDALYEDIGARIARARGNAEKSQNALAKLVAVSRTSVVNIEAGRQRPPIHLLWRIAEVLEVSLGDLLPTPKDLSAAAAPVQLDTETVREIERVAENNPAMSRLLVNFVQQAKRSLARREPSDGTSSQSEN